jgi:Peptide N-acetyl-beta-D-glucosaminyl asparaginase amidase A
MRASWWHRRRWLVLLSALLTTAALGGAATAMAAAAGRPAGHLHDLSSPALARAGSARPALNATGESGGSGATGPEFSTVANPMTLDAPVAVPPVKPLVVTVADKAAFGNAPAPYLAKVTLPAGRWAKVVLDVSGTESGTQYDRLCEVFDGKSQIFLGVTPEPTTAGISWHMQKDITGYLPILSGTRTFSTYVDNYTSSSDNGIPKITVKLLFYRAAGTYHAAHTATITSPALAGNAINETGPASPATEPGVPTTVVPIVPKDATNTLNTVNPGASVTASVTLPHNVTSAVLDLYAVGQGSSEEFWWDDQPAFREIEVSIDGKPAGVVWPYPYVYTGGVNPLIWQPLTGVHTMDIPSYRLDLTPFAAELGGTHTISLTVVNNSSAGSYWLAGGSLLLTDGGSRVTGSVTKDTLKFPHASTTTTVDGLGSADFPATTEAAAAGYRITGKVRQGRHLWYDTEAQSLTFANDQTYYYTNCSTTVGCYSWVHASETQTSAQGVSGSDGSGFANFYDSQDKASWTIEGPGGYVQNTNTDDATDFLLAAGVDQQLTDFATGYSWGLGHYQSDLSESILGYGALEENNSGAPITDGDTTGTITQVTSAGGVPASYLRTVVTRGGQVLQDTSASG